MSFKTGAKLSLLGEERNGALSSMAPLVLVDDEFDHTRDDLDANDFDPGNL